MTVGQRFRAVRAVRARLGYGPPSVYRNLLPTDEDRKRWRAERERKERSAARRARCVAVATGIGVVLKRAIGRGTD